ncbi:hypothetical protein BDZ97DRAFT_1862762, partial [Flammula alnicola]
MAHHLESLGSYVGVCSVVVWVWVTHTLFRCGSRLFTVLSGCVSTSGFLWCKGGCPCTWWHHHPPRALPPPCHQALGWPPPRTPPCRQHCVLWLFVGRGGFWGGVSAPYLLAIVFVFASFRSVSVMFWISSEAWHARWHVRWLFLRRAAGVRGLWRSCAAVRWFCGDLGGGGLATSCGIVCHVPGGLCGPGDMHYLVWSSSHFFNWSCLSYRRPSLLWGHGPWWS